MSYPDDYVLSCMLCGLSFKSWLAGERVDPTQLASGEPCPCGEDPYEVMWFRQMRVSTGPSLGHMLGVEAAEPPAGVVSATKLRLERRMAREEKEA
jgi:hypothetical protein